MTTVLEGVVEGTMKIFGASPRVIERLSRATSFPHPDYVNAQRTGRSTWGLPERFRTLVEFPDGSVELPRGSIEAIRDVLRREDVAVKWVDRRSVGDPIEGATQPPLRDYQAYGKRRLREVTQGVISLPCGTGKTRLGVACVVELSRCALIITHTGDLADQWVKDLRELAGIEAGLFNAERRDVDAPVVVASVFSLAPFLETEEGRSWARRFGTVIVDEAHHAPAETFQRALARVPARYRLGLTATPEREDGLTDLVFWSMGAMLLEKTTEEMIARGYLMLPEIENVETGFHFYFEGASDDPRRTHALDEQIENDAARNELIADIAAREGLAGEWVFVLVQRKAHAFALGRLVYERGCPCLALTGGGGKRAKESRKLALENMRDGKGEHVLIGTSLLDEGVNVPRLSRLILGYPAKAQGAITQRTGRVIRDFEGKKPKIFDIIDPHVETLVRRAQERRRLFKNLGLVK